jgi:uncharacterized protein
VKVVLDTNVYISGIFFTGPPYQILEAWRDARIKIIVSPDILDEYRRVAKDLAKQFPGIDLQPILELLTVNAEVVLSEDLPEPVCTDPDDDKFLACALTGGGDIIISGDKHLLRVSGYKALNILSPRRFVDDHL